MNLFQTLEMHARTDPGKTAVVVRDERISYGELLDRADRVAAGLERLGLRRGDRLALAMHNGPEFLYCFYGAMRLGLITVSLNVMFKKEEMDHILNDSRPGAVIVDEACLPVVEQTDAVRAGRLKVVVSSRQPSGQGGLHGTTLGSFLAQDAPAGTGPGPAPGDEAVIAYTSGTTGFPKGAVHTHENILVHLDGIRRHLGFDSNDVVLAALPFFQLVAFLIHPVLAIHVGATVVILERFEPGPFLRAVREEEVTFFAAVPTIYHMMDAAPEARQEDLATVRFGICAGSPLPVELRHRFEERFRFRIIHCYGMTEISLIAACEDPREEPRGVSVGRVLPYIRLRLVDEEGREVSAGRVGEIQVGAERALKYYWNLPAETEAALREGWFSTGDMGRLDEEGYLTIVDRKKDMIIRGGFNVYPAEIERVLLQDERVDEVAVIGIPHVRLGEVPKAFVVLKPGARATEKELLDLCRERLAHYKALEEVEFVDRGFFPRNALGKILKTALRKSAVGAEKERRKA